MAEKDSTRARSLCRGNQRFRYIGFEVFPREPKDLFRSEEEKRRLVEHVVEKRQRGDLLREECQLLEDRVSLVDRLALTLASLMILVSLFLPWYSFYNETIEQIVAKPAAAAPAVAETLLLPSKTAWVPLRLQQILSVCRNRLSTKRLRIKC